MFRFLFMQLREIVNHLEGRREEDVGIFNFPALYSLWEVGIKGIHWEWDGVGCFNGT